MNKLLPLILLVSFNCNAVEYTNSKGTRADYNKAVKSMRSQGYTCRNGGSYNNKSSYCYSKSNRKDVIVVKEK